jgi:hypothetical protein
MNVLLLTTLLIPRTVIGQGPAVEEAPGKVVITNEHYRATILTAQGGALAEVALPDGTPVLAGERLYSDHGLLPEPYYLGSDREAAAEVSVRRENDKVFVECRGVLRGASETQRRVEYTFEYTFDPSPRIHISWSATANFALARPNGFFSYLIGVPRHVEWFAKTAEGVIFQPAGPVNGRTYQSSIEALDPADPWVGVLLPDGTLLGWSGFQGEPPLTNVFMHESGQGSTAVFCAWLSGDGAADLVEGRPWSAACDLHVWPRATQGPAELPSFLGVR